jgi:hypothetical protein
VERKAAEEEDKSILEATDDVGMSVGDDVGDTDDAATVVRAEEGVAEVLALLVAASALIAKRDMSYKSALNPKIYQYTLRVSLLPSPCLVLITH